MDQYSYKKRHNHCKIYILNICRLIEGIVTGDRVINYYDTVEILCED